MRRVLLSATVFLALAAWAGAQGPSPALSPAAHCEMFKTNQDLLQNLVYDGIKLADVDSPLQRAEQCSNTASMLARFLNHAATDQNADRVVELAGLMTDVVRDGLVPNLNAAREQIKPGDPREAALIKVRDDVAHELGSIAGKLPADGNLAANQRVREAIEQLTALKSTLKTP
jgi:hypothetical protein